MRRGAAWVVVVLACGCGPGRGSVAPRVGPMADVGWLSGMWVDDHGTREVWSPAEGGVMLGVNRSAGDEHIELLRLQARDGALVYTAVPPGQAITEFRADSTDGTSIVFENPEHDFPTAITYGREGDDRMSATISGSASDRSVRWDFHREAERDAFPIKRQTGTVTRNGEELTVELPGGFCARLLCAVLPGPTLQVAVLDTSNDCTGPAKGQCPAAGFTATGEQPIEFFYSMD